MSWADAGAQRVAKGDHKKPKPGELTYHRGGVLTVLNGLGFLREANSSGEAGLINARDTGGKEGRTCGPQPQPHALVSRENSGADAVSELQPAEQGLFLVRESIRHPGDCVLCVSVSESVMHYRVIYWDNKLTINNHQFFYNLINVIEVDGSWTRSNSLWPANLNEVTCTVAQVLHAGVYISQEVAVKTIKCDVTAQAFLRETTVMTRLQHKNLVRLFGVTLDKELQIVTELMGKGDLGNLRSRGCAVVLVGQLRQYALDVCEGMEYLESENLVHRDLAARNVLVSDSNVAKISGFGLIKVGSRTLDNARLPIKWSAPEALKKETVTEVKDMVEDGYHMEAPEDCPAELYSVMRTCWEQDPRRRPTFHKLRHKLEATDSKLCGRPG